MKWFEFNFFINSVQYLSPSLLNYGEVVFNCDAMVINRCAIKRNVWPPHRGGAVPSPESWVEIAGRIPKGSNHLVAPIPRKGRLEAEPQSISVSERFEMFSTVTCTEVATYFEVQ